MRAPRPLTAPQIQILKYCADPTNEPAPSLTAGLRGAANGSTWEALERRGLIIHGVQGNRWPENRHYLTVEGEAALLEAAGIVAPAVVCTCYQTERYGPHRPDGLHWFLDPIEPGNFLSPRRWVQRHGRV